MKSVAPTVQALILLDSKGQRICSKFWPAQKYEDERKLETEIHSKANMQKNDGSNFVIF